LRVLHDENKIPLALFDNNMQLVKPVQLYLKHIKGTNKEPNTIIAQMSDLKMFWTFLSYRGVDYTELTPTMIDDFIIYLKEPFHRPNVYHLNVKSVRKPKTINRTLKTVYQFYIYWSNLLNCDNPIIMEEIRRPMGMFKSMMEHARKNDNTVKSMFKVSEENESFNIISESEYEILSEAMPSRRDKLLFKVLYYSGVRISEALGLTIEMIPVPDNTKKVGSFNIYEVDENDLDRQLKTGSRIIYMPMSVLKELDNFIMEERIRINTEHSYIFVSNQKRFLGKPLTRSNVEQLFERISKKTGININPHDLRHTCCTNLIQGGMDIAVAQIIMGHAHISTTQKYTHLSNSFVESKLDEYWKVTNILGGK